VKLWRNVKHIFIDYIERETSIRLQVGYQLATFLILGFMSRVPLSEEVLNFADPKPAINYFTPKQREETAISTTLVKTGCYIKDFPVFDPVKNNLVMESIIWFEFDPHAISLDVVNKFSFKRGKFLKKSEPNLRLIKGKLFVDYSVKVQFSSNLNYKNFPFNDHRIYLELINEFVTPKELMFISYESGISLSPEIYTGGWVNIASTADYGYITVQFEENDTQNIVSRPTVIFSLDYAQTGVKNIFLILIPILLMYNMAFFSLSLSLKKHMRYIMQLSIGAITALLAYRFVIERLSPQVGYFVGHFLQIAR